MLLVIYRLWWNNSEGFIDCDKVEVDAGVFICCKYILCFRMQSVVDAPGERKILKFFEYLKQILKIFNINSKSAIK